MTREESGIGRRKGGWRRGSKADRGTARSCPEVRTAPPRHPITSLSQNDGLLDKTSRKTQCTVSPPSPLTNILRCPDFDSKRAGQVPLPWTAQFRAAFDAPKLCMASFRNLALPDGLRLSRHTRYRYRGRHWSCSDARHRSHTGTHRVRKPRVSYNLAPESQRRKAKALHSYAQRAAPGPASRVDIGPRSLITRRSPRLALHELGAAPETAWISSHQVMSGSH